LEIAFASRIEIGGSPGHTVREVEIGGSSAEFVGKFQEIEA